MIEVIESALQKAAGEGMDEFIQVFTDKYKEVIGGELTADTMPLLTGEQHSLLAYQIFRDEIMVGGFCQLIQNGYGGYIFDNPFAKVILLGHHGREEKLPQLWQDISTSMTRSYHGRGDLTIPASFSYFSYYF